MSRVVEVEAIPTAAGPKAPVPSWGALEKAGNRLVYPDSLVVDADTGRPVAVHHRLPPDAMPLAEALARELPHVRYEAPAGVKSNAARLSGMRNPHRVFGHSPPVPLRRRFWCGVSHFDTEFPDVAAGLRHMTPYLWRLFAGRLPDVAAAHWEAVDETINRDWWLGPRLDPIPFTSGIINRTSALPYHRDASNVAGSWSSMVVMRRRVGGAYLHLPGYGVAFACPNGSVVSFSGGEHLHGVTPLDRRPGGDSYRYSIVWYAKSEMSQCGSADAELHRARLAATAHEDDRATRIQKGEIL